MPHPNDFPISADEAAAALAQALRRLDVAVGAVQARMGELAEARKAKQAAMQVPIERIKPATREIKPGTGSLRLNGKSPAAPARPVPPPKPPARPSVSEVVERHVPAAGAEDAAERLLQTLETQAERLESRE